MSKLLLFTILFFTFVNIKSILGIIMSLFQKQKLFEARQTLLDYIKSYVHGVLQQMEKENDPYPTNGHYSEITEYAKTRLRKNVYIASLFSKQIAEKVNIESADSTDLIYIFDSLLEGYAREHPYSKPEDAIGDFIEGYDLVQNTNGDWTVVTLVGEENE